MYRGICILTFEQHVHVHEHMYLLLYLVVATS